LAGSSLHRHLERLRSRDDVTPRRFRQRDRSFPSHPGPGLGIAWRHHALEPWGGGQPADLLGKGRRGCHRFGGWPKQPRIEGQEKGAGPSERAFVATLTASHLPTRESLPEDLREKCKRVALVSAERKQRAAIQEGVRLGAGPAFTINDRA